MAERAAEIEELRSLLSEQIRQRMDEPPDRLARELSAVECPGDVAIFERLG
jgi:predicted Zn-dependent peptidase